MQSQTKPKLQQIEEMAKLYWEDPTFDITPQSFYFPIVNMLNLQNANNILEVGAGACLMIYYALEIKNLQANYFATDLSEQMLEIGRNRLKRHLEKYQTELSLEKWMQKNKLVIKKANGELPFELGQKFDRIICNMVLMVVQNPEIMLKNLYDQSDSGCLMGASVWGNKASDLFFPVIEESMKEYNVENPDFVSKYHLYNKLSGIAEKVGWKTVVCWEQVTTFPYLRAEECSGLISIMIKDLQCSEQIKGGIFRSFMDKIVKILEDKRALTFGAQIYIFKKQ